MTALAPEPQRSTAPPEPAPISFAEVLAAVRRRQRLLMAILGIVGVVTVGVLLALRDYYSSTISLVPEARQPSGIGQLGGLAAIAGLSLGSLGSGQTPQFYEAVLRERPIRYAVVLRSYPTRGLRNQLGVDSITLVKLFARKDRGIYDLLRPPRTEADRIARAAKKVSRFTDVDVDIKSGIVHLSVSYWDRDIAADIANAYADELVRLNAETRQTQARARRIFLDGRVERAEQDLRRAEDAVRSFMERNRTYESSPALRFEYTNLQRALTVQQELYLDLRRQLDAARISEVDDVPALSIIERAIPAQRKSSPNRSLFLTVTLVATGLLAGGAVAIWEYRTRLFPSGAVGLGTGRPYAGD